MSAVDTPPPILPLEQARPDLEIDRLLRALVKLKGSDLHLKVGRAPLVRVTGVLRALNRGPVDDVEMERLVAPLLSPRHREILEATGGVDLAYPLTIDGGSWRFRTSIFRQLGHLGLAARAVPPWIADFSALHLPQALDKFCQHGQGLVLLAGETGAGKTTTIAAMLDHINHRFQKHILTLEDPVEYTFADDKCLINQREIGLDVATFDLGMKQAVREDPDVMVVGEIRDRDSFTAAIQAAETGHLVFATIHASSAVNTIGRLLDFFPADAHTAIRRAIAFNVLGVVAQQLLPSMKPGVALVPMVEIMFITPSIQKLIQSGDDARIGDAIRLGSHDGMQDFTASLKGLVDAQLVDRAVALQHAPKREEFQAALRGIEVSSGGLLGV